MRRAIAAGCLMFGVGCKPPPPPAPPPPCLEHPLPTGEAVARVGDRPITVEQIAALIREQGRVAERRYSEPDRLLRFVEDQVRFELLVRAAHERGLDRDPDVVEAARKVMVRKLLQSDMGDEAFGSVQETAIERYFERHKDEYIQPEKRRFAEIQLAPTEEGRILAQALIEQLTDHPTNKALFQTLSTRYSRKKLVRTPGIHDLFQSHEELRAEYGPSFADEVFQSPPDGLIPHPVQSTKGWHVIKMLAVRLALTRTLDDVRDEIREKLQLGQRSTAFEEYLNSLKRRFPVAIYDGRLPQVVALLKPEEQSDRP